MFEIIKLNSYEVFFKHNNKEYYAEFNVEWDIDIPMVQICSTDAPEDLDLTELEQDIEQGGSCVDWESDRVAMAADYAYDMWREG